MKLVCELVINGTETLETLAATSNLDMAASALKTTPGVGKPFLFFASLSGKVATANFDLHPDWAGDGNVVDTDVTKNRAILDAMLASPPTDAITY